MSINSNAQCSVGEGMDTYMLLGQTEDGGIFWKSVPQKSLKCTYPWTPRALILGK